MSSIETHSIENRTNKQFGVLGITVVGKGKENSLHHEALLAVSQGNRRTWRKRRLTMQRGKFIQITSRLAPHPEVGILVKQKFIGSS